MTWTKVSIGAIVCTGIIWGCYIFYRERKRRTDSTTSVVEQKRIEPPMKPSIEPQQYIMDYVKPPKPSDDKEVIKKYCLEQIDQANYHLERNECEECAQKIADAVASHDEDENGVFIQGFKKQLPFDTFEYIVKHLPDHFDKKKLISEYNVESETEADGGHDC